MAFFFLQLLSFLLLSATSSHATLPAKVYWHTVLPNTPMPEAIQDRILPAGEAFDAKKAGLSVSNKDDISHIQWDGPATAAQIRDKASSSLFFHEKDLVPGAKLSPIFKSTLMAKGPPFLPSRISDAVPFSSEKLPQILDRFSVKPGSSQAEAIEKTLQVCEKPAFVGERKLCATSLESMVEFAMSVLGTRDVRAVSTKVLAVKKAAPEQQYYTVGPAGVRRMAGSGLVVCHAMAYPHAVFYCHSVPGLRGYTVDLVGAEGAAIAAVSVCHTDTTAWNPKHIALQVLKAKPGDVSVCHEEAPDNIVWAAAK